MPTRILLIGCGLLLLSGCSAGEPGSAAVPTAQAKDRAMPTARVTLYPEGLKQVSVAVEVVSKPADRRKGLMYRKQLADDAGMLFLFEREQQLSFWMRNTYIPLDMIFIKSDMTVLGIVENAEPRTDAPRRVPGRSRYVLEVKAGFSKHHGVSPGTRVRFEGVSNPFEGAR